MATTLLVVSDRKLGDWEVRDSQGACRESCRAAGQRLPQPSDEGWRLLLEEVPTAHTEPSSKQHLAFTDLTIALPSQILTHIYWLIAKKFTVSLPPNRHCYLLSTTSMVPLHLKAYFKLINTWCRGFFLGITCLFHVAVIIKGEETCRKTVRGHYVRRHTPRTLAERGKPQFTAPDSMKHETGSKCPRSPNLIVPDQTFSHFLT